MRASICNICLSEISIQGDINSCSHEFCFSCIERWSKTQNTCPLCIKRFTKIKQSPKRTVYARSTPGIEITVATADQAPNHFSLVEYLIRIGLVEGRDFIVIRRADQETRSLQQ